MVSMMDVEPKKGQFCDMSRPKVTPSSADSELAKRAFKLSLKSSFSTSVEDSSTRCSGSVRQQLSQQESAEVRSPLSPNSGEWLYFFMWLNDKY